jgi:membrane protease subunit (stomatin/prohibitin family)
MAIIDHANFDFEGRKIFAYEYPEKNLSSNTQLNVRPGQEALLVLGGRIEMKYPPNGPRPYTLDTANLPVVRKLFGIPFGGSNPILAAVWFINKADLVNMEIVTDTFLLKDPSKPQGFPAIAIANVGIQVEEGEPFFLKLVNGNPCFSEADMIKAIQGRVTRVISEKISQLVDQLGLSVAEINSRLSMISQQSRDVCLQLIKEWGLQFVDFNVRITQDTSQEGLMMASGFGTDRESFERQRILDIQEKAINNLSGGGNGLLGAVLAMGMVNSMNSSPRQGGSYGQSQQNQPQQPMVNPNAHMVYCGNCGKKYDAANSRFCPNCGKEYIPCPKCGSDNLPGSRRCVNCGQPLQTAASSSSFCPRCGAQVPGDSNFCPKCGNKIK